MGHPMRNELTREGLEIKLANYYTISRFRFKPKTWKVEIITILHILKKKAFFY